MGHHHHHRLESTKPPSSDQSIISSSAQQEVEQMRKTKDFSKKNNRPDKANSELPNLTIDDCSEQKDRSYEELKPNGNRVVHLQSASGGSSEIEYNDQNQPIRYRDFSNEEYTNTEPGNADGIWKSTSNLVQKDGVKISFDATTKAITLTDMTTKDVVTTTAGGIETTTYPPSNGSTTRKVVGKEEWISTHDANGSVREMYIVDNKLQRYTDDRNITYTLTGKNTEPKRKGDDPANPLTCAPIFKAVGPDGQEIPGTFTISGNRTGNVLVRNEDAKSEPECCRRTRVDGAIITSDSEGTIRKFRTAGGVEIETKILDKSDAMKITQKTIRNLDGSTIEATLSNGEPGHIKQTDVNGQVTEYQQVVGLDANVEWRNQNDEVVADPSKLADTTSYEDGPMAIQKTTAVDMKAMLAECDQHPLGYTNPQDWEKNGKLFLKNVNYGGVWDVKSPATRTTNADNEELIVKDQLGRPDLEDFGNLLFGVLGHRVGFSSHTLQEEAGAAQIKEGTSRPNWGRPGIGTRGIRIPLTGSGTYGDDPHDNELIQQGYNDSQRLEGELTKTV